MMQAIKNQPLYGHIYAYMLAALMYKVNADKDANKRPWTSRTKMVSVILFTHLPSCSEASRLGLIAFI